MTSMTFRRATLAGALIGALCLTGCSGGDGDTADSTSTTTAGTTPSEVSVVIDPEILDKLNVDSGEAVEPGSIKSERVDTLDEDCTAAVAPLRELMAKYPSLRQVPPDGTYDNAFSSAKSVCEPANPQQWADFYTRELAGWIYAAASGEVSSSDTTTGSDPATSTTGG